MFSRFRLSSFIAILAVMLTLLGLSACNLPGGEPPTSTAAPTAAVTPTAVPTALPSPTPTAVPKVLTICVGQEPGTLYPYGGTSRSMWSVLEAVYDGPIDIRQYTPQPVILQDLPSLANGGAVVQPVDVKTGDEVVNADGALVNLAKDQKVIPSGCNSGDCAVTWDGQSALKVDQLTLTFKLKPGIKWSDGQAVTAADSLYSYQVASSKDTPVSKFHVYRTQSYQAVDDSTIKWAGIPGYIPASYESLFWIPLPKHAWQSLTPTQLLTSDLSAKKPMGWGPYQIDEWTPGDHIRLVKNPQYYRAAEGLPKFDVLVYRFLGEPADNKLEALLSGECDVVDNTSLLDANLEAVLDLQKAGKLKAAITQGPEWEFLAFGIKPASYDDGYQPGTQDRPDFFSDVRTRQAFAYCINRQAIIDKELLGQSSIPGGYLPPNHPLFMKDLLPLPFDPEKGKALLDQAGWKNFSNDPSKPRVAAMVLTVNPGTPFIIDYITTEAPLRVEIAKLITANLADCGVQVNLKVEPVNQVYQPGPAGALFGRNFDLAQFSWATGLVPPCQLFESSQIPSAANNWLTVNLTGYSNPVYDAACQAARYTRPDNQDNYVKNYQTVQSLFSADLPVIPLYFRTNLAVTRPDFCGLEMDATGRSDLSNIEAFDEGGQCKK
jgi:peptide/nickel transport system substrate-binding protein